MGTQKNHLTEMVLLSTHMFWLRNKKIKFSLGSLYSPANSLDPDQAGRFVGPDLGVQTVKVLSRWH